MDILNYVFCGVFIFFVAAVLLKHGKGGGLWLDFQIIECSPRVLVSVIFVLAVTVRLYQFGSVPGGVNQDEAMAAVDAFALAAHGTDRFGMWMPVHFTAWGYGQMSVLLSYLMVPFIRLFGLNIVTVRLPMLLVSIVGLYVLYRFCLAVFGRFTATATLFLAAINPWHIMQSRWSLDCNLFPHFILFSLYFLHKGIRNKRFLYIAMIFFALSMYTYGIAFYTVPLMLFVLCGYMLYKKIVDYKTAVLCGLVYLFFAWPVIAVIVINYFKLPTIATPFFTIPFFPDSVRANDLLFFSEDIPRQAVRNLYSLLDTAFFQFPDLPWNTIAAFGATFLFSLPFLYAGVRSIFLIRKEPGETDQTKDFGVYLILFWFLAAIFAGMVINGVNVNRINLIFYPMILLTALGVRYILSNAANRQFIFTAVTVIYAVAFMLFSHTYFGEHSVVLSQNFYDGFGASVAYAEAQDKEVLYITSYTQSEGAAHVSKIITEFYAGLDAEYMQGKTEKTGSGGQPLPPYADRYLYTSFTAPITMPQRNAAYVYNQREAAFFSPEEFELFDFGYYGVAIPK